MRIYVYLLHQSRSMKIHAWPNKNTSSNGFLLGLTQDFIFVNNITLEKFTVLGTFSWIFIMLAYFLHVVYVLPYFWFFLPFLPFTWTREAKFWLDAD